MAGKNRNLMYVVHRCQIHAARREAPLESRGLRSKPRGT